MPYESLLIFVKIIHKITDILQYENSEIDHSIGTCQLELERTMSSQSQTNNEIIRICPQQDLVFVSYLLVMNRKNVLFIC